MLGNWNGNDEQGVAGPLPGRMMSISTVEPGSGGTTGTRNRRDITDAQNRLVTRVNDTGGGGGGSGGGSGTTTHLAFDAAGNLTCDGTYFYQYDAWNRLVQVNRAVPQTLPNGGTTLASDGHTSVDYIWVPGVMLKHYVYDGLGRLICTQSPFPHADFPHAGVRSEHFYYDGIRRVQEVVVDPLLAMDNAGDSGDPGVEGAADQAQADSPYVLDGSAAPLAYENAQKNVLAIQVYVEREYIWGPGDKGVDELLVQFDHTVDRKPWWVIQDDGGDVVAVCDTIATGANAGKGRVVQQLTYDAYGEALSSTTLVAHPVLRCGHKALFVDRLDVGVSSTSGIEWERVIPFAHILCQNRNRVYSPQVGRFLQADPNASGDVLIRSISYHGSDVPPLVDCASLDARFTDGLNIYAYLTSNTWIRFDPLGLTVIPEGASPLDAGLAPYFIGILQGIEARLMGLLVQHYAKIAVAAEVAYGMASPDPGVGGLFPAGAKAAGKFGEAILDGLGGNTHVYFKTSQGRRFMDRVVNGVAYEVKTGFFELCDAIKLQAWKDKEILRDGGTIENPVEVITWVFFSNPNTGRAGCDTKLKEFLEGLGIKVLEILREE